MLFEGMQSSWLVGQLVFQLVDPVDQMVYLLVDYLVGKQVV